MRDQIKILNIIVHINNQCKTEMTSIIWYIYNEFLKKEKDLVEKHKKKEMERLDRIRNIGGSGNERDEKK